MIYSPRSVSTGVTPLASRCSLMAISSPIIDLLLVTVLAPAASAQYGSTGMHRALPVLTRQGEPKPVEPATAIDLVRLDKLLGRVTPALRILKKRRWNRQEEELTHSTTWIYDFAQDVDEEADGVAGSTLGEIKPVTEEDYVVEKGCRIGHDQTRGKAEVEACRIASGSAARRKADNRNAEESALRRRVRWADLFESDESSGAAEASDLWTNGGYGYPLHAKNSGADLESGSLDLEHGNNDEGYEAVASPLPVRALLPASGVLGASRVGAATTPDLPSGTPRVVSGETPGVCLRVISGSIAVWRTTS